MNLFYKFLQKLSYFSLSLIPINYKINHKFLNRNQVTNSSIILSLLKDKINPKYILDIGCGHGEWFLKCNLFFPKAKYLLFDANKYNESRLKVLKNKNSNIFYKICLLSETIKNQKFFNMGYGSSVYEENTNFMREVEHITSTTLKHELSNFKLDTNNNMIKLDVQGSEIDILKGLGSNIDLFEIILLETSVKEYNKGSPLFIDVINFMNEKNFSFYDIYDLKRLGMNKSFLVQFDAVFIRKNSSLLNFDVF
jgi:FkbM family methyltransferase|tara:strand:+ start:19 stop:774 length:756 start_codon:yes stop_codon:yes gene_type:complete